MRQLTWMFNTLVVTAVVKLAEPIPGNGPLMNLTSPDVEGQFLPSSAQEIDSLRFSMIQDGQSATDKDEPSPDADQSQQAPMDRLVCNFNVSAEDRPEPFRFTLSDLEVSNCTDVYYDSVSIDSFPVDRDVKAYFVWDFSQDIPVPRYKAVNGHKLENSKLRTFLVVAEESGGRIRHRRATNVAVSSIDQPSLTFHHLVEDDLKLLRFSAWSTHLLRLWGFDGLAIRWPMAAGPGRLETLLLAVRAAVDTETRKFRGYHKSSNHQGSLDLLQVAVILDTSNPAWLRRYNMHMISKLVDQITLEAPVSSLGQSKVARIVQPLHPIPGLDGQPSIEETLDIAVQTGVDRHKVNVAISLTGLAFERSSPDNHSVGAEVTGCVSKGRCHIYYHETCRLGDTTGTFARVSQADLSPYWYNSSSWLSFEDLASISQKMSYLRGRSIGGVTIMSQSEDDFSGQFCDGGLFPITAHVHHATGIRETRKVPLPWEAYCNTGVVVYLANTLFPTVCSVVGMIVSNAMFMLPVLYI